MTIRRIVLSLAAAGLLLSMASYGLAQEEAPIYGQELMTVAERMQHRARMRALETEDDRAAFRAQHRKEIQVRARERDVELPDVAVPKGSADVDAAPGRGLALGRDLMTGEERERHRLEMRSKSSAEEQERYRHEHHEEMKKRARGQGLGLPDQPLPRGRGPHAGSGGGGPGQGRRR